MARNKSQQRRLRVKALKRDKGICSRCDRDCKAIDDELLRLNELDNIHGSYRANNYMRSIGLTSWSSWHAHHVVKRSDGGPDHIDNIITLCQWCHDGLHYKNKIQVFLEPIQ